MSDVVMIHGMLTGPWIWDGQKRMLEQRGHTCVAPALRYHDLDPGAPPDPALGKTSILDYASDVQPIVFGLDEAPVLLGHSMGGLIAQIIASRKTVKALVLLTPSAPNGITTSEPAAVRGYFAPLKRWGFWRKPWRPTFDQACSTLMNTLDPGEQRRIYERLGWESGRAAFELGFHALDSKKASRVDCAKVKCPVLVIAGSEDHSIPPSMVRRIPESYADATYREFAGRSHFLWGEPKWEEVVEYIAGWLDGI